MSRSIVACGFAALFVLTLSDTDAEAGPQVPAAAHGMRLGVPGQHETHSAAARAAGRDDLAVEVQWKGKATDLTTIEMEVGAVAAETAAHWAPLAHELEAYLHLTDDGRVLLLSDGNSSQVKKQMELIARTAAAVDETLPLPEREPDPEIDEDVPADEIEGEGRLYMPRPQDDATVVLIEAADADAYKLVLAHLMRTEDYLDDWLPTAAVQSGFSLKRPLCATWIRNLDGQEEFDVRNEIVHRLSNLLVGRRFGELPFWLECGMAWHFEESLLGEIYCFPYRSGFVFASEHSSWTSDLATQFRGKDEPFFERLCDWRRGTYQGTQARRAFGFARFMAEHHREEFGAVLDGLFDLRSRDGVNVMPDGLNWELIPGWEPSADQQLAVFEEHLGEGVLSEVTRYFEKGKKYKPSKRS
jgi:hypothetical protein